MAEEKGFKYWFENVFWYHYRWWFLGGVFLIALVVFIALEASGSEKYDLTVVFAQSGDVTEEQAQTVLDAIAASVGDLDGNGEISLGYISINTGETASDGGGQSVSMQDRLLLCLSDEDYVLFFMDGAQSETCCALGYIEDRLSDYGIETPEDDPYRVSVSGSEAFSEAGLSGTDYYALLIDWTTVGKGSAESTEAAVRAIAALVS